MLSIPAHNELVLLVIESKANGEDVIIFIDSLTLVIS